MNKVTVISCPEVEIIEKKSRFIGNLCHAESADAANDFIKKIKEKYSDATHNVYAYDINNGVLAKCSDDGEPQGTSGYPSLLTIKNSGLTDICVVITRYFGGTLLGASGLTRAYTETVRKLLDSSVRAVYKSFDFYSAVLNYSENDRIMYYLRKNDVEITDVIYDEKVKVFFKLPSDESDKVVSALTDLTNGNSEIEKLDRRTDLIEEKKK